MAHVTKLPLGQGPEMIHEHWVRFFCEKDEYKQLLKWLHEEGLSRPSTLDERLTHAERLRQMGNDWYRQGDLRRALHCLMGAVHALDFSPSEQMAQEPPEREHCSRVMLPVMSNLAMVFLKRGDMVNADKAATAGLRCATKLPDEETAPLRAKLLYRRGLARGQDERDGCRDLDGALSDLLEAAKLEPANREIRHCLANCKELIAEQRKADPIRYKPREAKVKEEPAAGAEAAEAVGAEGAAPGPPELPPALDKFAECVGRCLGRSRRVYRQVREGRLPEEIQRHYWLVVATLCALIAVLVGLALKG